MTGNDAGIADGRTDAAAPADPAASPSTDNATTTPDTSGRTVAWLGFGFGAILSVLANWLYTYLPRDTHATAQHPGVAPQIGSAVWPLVLMLSVEVLLRVRWLPGVWWRLARYAGIGTVALGSAVISYGHVYHVLLSWGYDAVGAHVGPLAIDGFMVICGFALLSESTRLHGNAIAGGSGNIDAPNRVDANPVPGSKGDTTCDEGDRIGDAADSPCDTAQSTRDGHATGHDAAPDPDRDNRIRGMARAGMSTREIGRIVRLHHSTVARIVAQGDTSGTESDGTAPLRLITATDQEAENSCLRP
ncbi:helix-turn-helix domain-containing protein [Nocardia yunnanensis]|uniref:Helix-turn-helix domain-containing protein n=1 Tax=Nocardia yunnanensis TaxID=2382165 RepID=A0A386ZDY7_9NOCA|nr:helix-turn-helix domain-containing protein [Nocardia yunnanensis]AYF76092.1 helix-turn-helix domain-containing protein [Nocardia yunnanensis]